jgi:hypothetical protein
MIFGIANETDNRVANFRCQKKGRRSLEMEGCTIGVALRECDLVIGNSMKPMGPFDGKVKRLPVAGHGDANSRRESELQFGREQPIGVVPSETAHRNILPHCVIGLNADSDSAALGAGSD